MEGLWKLAGVEVVEIEGVVVVVRGVLPWRGDLLLFDWEDNWPRDLRGEALRWRGLLLRRLSRLPLVAMELRQEMMRSELGGLDSESLLVDLLLFRVATEVLRPSIFLEKVEVVSHDSLRRFL